MNQTGQQDRRSSDRHVLALKTVHQSDTETWDLPQLP